ncbi:translation initiation factor IF-2-like isoform X2 [Gallus gallus]|uniref:translation initiation factor IF-2-like isoform X2 n=1 Tax=Gallus gallus TaxID=9031 RepID=UPI001AEA9C48|nr:translation initiation factor IF-2-like isoform X2 [Gallus gallus]
MRGLRSACPTALVPINRSPQCFARAQQRSAERTAVKDAAAFVLHRRCNARPRPCPPPRAQSRAAAPRHCQALPCPDPAVERSRLTAGSSEEGLQHTAVPPSQLSPPRISAAAKPIAGRLFTAALGAQSSPRLHSPGSGGANSARVPGWVTARRCGAAVRVLSGTATGPALPPRAALPSPGAQRPLAADSGSALAALRPAPAGSAAGAPPAALSSEPQPPTSIRLLTRLGPLLRSPSRPGPESPLPVSVLPLSAAGRSCPAEPSRSIAPTEPGSGPQPGATRGAELRDRSPHSKANPALSAAPGAGGHGNGR